METQSAFVKRTATISDKGLALLVDRIAVDLGTEPDRLYPELRFSAWIYRQWRLADDANGLASEVVDDLREIEQKSASIVEALAAIDMALDRLGPDVKKNLLIGAENHYGFSEMSMRHELGTMLRMIRLQALSADGARILEQATGYRKNRIWSVAMKRGSQRMLAEFCKAFAQDRGCTEEKVVVLLMQSIHAIESGEKVSVRFRNSKPKFTSQWGRRGVQAVFHKSDT